MLILPGRQIHAGEEVIWCPAAKNGVSKGETFSYSTGREFRTCGQSYDLPCRRHVYIACTQSATQTVKDG